MFDAVTDFFTSGDLPIEVLVLGAVVLLAVGVAQVASFRTALLVLGALFFVSSIAVAVDFSGRTQVQWLNPLQSQRSVLVFVVGTMLFFAVLGHSGRMVGRPWPAQTLLMLVIALYAGLIRIVHEGPGSGVSSIAFTLVTIAPAAFVLSALVDDWDDILRLVRTIAWANVVWIGGVVVQLLLDPGKLTVGKSGRFMGLLGNPQHAAVLLGMLAAIALWLYMNDPARRKRLIWLGLLAANIICLLWSGSRTGAGIFAIGIAITAYSRIGRSILLLPIAALGIMILIPIAEALGVDLSGAGRVGSLEDTRSHAWRTLIDAARSNPWVGVGVAETGRSENSYLYGFAAYGVGMLVLTAMLVLASIGLGLKLIRIRFRCAPPQRGLVDLAIAFNCMYFAGAVLEGYLMARVSATIVLFLSFAAISSRLVQIAREDPDWLTDPAIADPGGWDEEWDEWDGASETWDADDDPGGAPAPALRQA